MVGDFVVDEMVLGVDFFVDDVVCCFVEFFVDVVGDMG